MNGSIITLVIMILVIIAQIIKNIKESAEAAQKQRPDEEEELVIIARPKSGKQAKPGKQRSLTRQPLDDGMSILSGDSKPAKRQALSKKLSPQGEGQRFDADPGTLDTEHLVSPTFDSTVKPELESITGIYEEGTVYGEKSRPAAITVNMADYLAKPEGIVHAVIFAEILKHPAWQNETVSTRH